MSSKFKKKHPNFVNNIKTSANKQIHNAHKPPSSAKKENKTNLSCVLSLPSKLKQLHARFNLNSIYIYNDFFIDSLLWTNFLAIPITVIY